MPNQDPSAAPRHRGAAFVSESTAMDRAVRLGARSLVSARPNPPVGCVVLSASGLTVAEGRHIQPGMPHAEAIALQQAGQLAKNGTMVVTLEPCNHHGRTPPCTHRILDAGVRRVVYATPDSNPLAEGGAAFLEKHGIEVAQLPHQGADRLNAPHLTWSAKSRPYVIAKWAQSPDGFMCPPASHDRWISGTESRREVHRLRGRVDAVLTGLGTVQADDCRLDARLYRPRQKPLVAVASRNGAIPEKASIRTNQRLVHLSSETPQEQLGSLARLGVQVVLLEAGPRLLHVYWKAKVIDEAWVFVGPNRMPTGTGKSPISDAKQWISQHPDHSEMRFGPDRLLRMPIESN